MPQRLIRRSTPLLLWLLAAGCGGPSFLVPLHGDPEEARELLAEEGYTRDDRPASVRTTERFFGALEDEDAQLCWYLMDLRAAAAWQAALTPPGGEGPTPEDVAARLRTAWPAQTPDKVERIAYDPKANTARVRARWAKANRKAEIDLSLTSVGWRLVILPPGARLAAVDREPRPTDVAPPIERDLEEDPVSAPPRHSRPPFAGGGLGY